MEDITSHIIKISMPIIILIANMIMGLTGLMMMVMLEEMIMMRVMADNMIMTGLIRTDHMNLIQIGKVPEGMIMIIMVLGMIIQTIIPESL